MTWQDLRISIRGLLRAPGFATAAVITLAVAVGMATAVFSVVDALLLRPLPYKDAGRLALIWSSSNHSGRDPVSFDDFEDWRRDSKTLESAALYTAYYKPTLSGTGYSERLNTLLVSHQYFAVLAAQPLLGRFFLPEEDRDGRDDIVVLSYDLWRLKFHSDPQVVGRSILLDSRPHIIVGVAGPDLLPLPPSLAETPAQLYRPIGEAYGPGSRDGRHLEAIVRLRRGVSIQQAQAELDLRSKQMQREHPVVDAKLAASIVGLRDDMTRNVRTPIWTLQGAVLMLVLIACANIANLLLAKSSGRRRELAVRSALGAGTARLARLLLSESVILGLTGGFCGLLLSVWAIAGINAVTARVLPDAGTVTVDSRVLVFSLGVSLGAALLFGIAPIFRINSGQLIDSLRFGNRVAGDQRNGLRKFLAAGQIALSLVLLVSTGLLGKSFLRLRVVNPGFDPQGVLLATVAAPSARYPSQLAVSRYFNRALADLRVLPGVQEAETVSVVPLSGDFDRTGFEIVGKHFQPGEAKSPDRYIVSPGYFRALRIPLRQGRVFESSDDGEHPAVCVISETAARLWFSGRSPLGEKIRAGSASGSFDTSPFREVVGVVGDIAQYGLGLPATPQIYMPHAQFATHHLTFLVRSTGDPQMLAGAVGKSILAVDPESPVFDVRPLEQIVSNTFSARRLGLWLLAIFAFSALSLASMGVYAVVSYSVAQRTAEFGIRMALGARPNQILRSALDESLGMIGAGLGAGLIGSWMASRALASFLFGVSSTDVEAFAILPLFLGLVAVVACYLPAHRAAQVDPLTALRSD